MVRGFNKVPIVKSVAPTPFKIGAVGKAVKGVASAIGKKISAIPIKNFSAGRARRGTSTGYMR